jgi:hypothetical protein
MIPKKNFMTKKPITISDNLLFSLTLSNKLKNIAIQLESHNDLISFEKEILCDRVKSIFSSFDSIHHFAYFFKQVEEKLVMNSRLTQQILLQTQETSSKFEETLKKQDNFLTECQDFLSTKETFKKNYEKTFRVFKEKVNFLQSSLSQALQEKDQFKSKSSELEKKLFDCSKELKKLRKLKKRKTSGVDLEEEKFCSKCSQSFYEKDNFNWSCRTHLGLLQNGFFWCCGKKGKTSPGCVLSKHVAQEEKSETFEELSPVKFCTDCKKTGHLFVDCPKDPNFKTRGEYLEERKRLERLYLSRRRLSVLESQSGADQRIFHDISEKMRGSEFERNFDTQEEIDEFNGVFFGDLIEIKEEVLEGFQGRDGSKSFCENLGNDEVLL